MTKIQCRFKMIKFLNKLKIRLYIPLKPKMKISFWMTNLIGLFVKFDSPIHINMPIIEVNNLEELEQLRERVG